jgi:putative nucleotidyltransferase-like protein
MLARFQAHATRRQLRELAAVLAPLNMPLIALQGSAYVLQNLLLSEGRSTSDVDLMVAREHLGRAEAALKSAGWEYGKMDPYDERYYREWVHELPPMRFPGRFLLELDLHHTILPLTGRIQPDSAALLDASNAVQAPG